MNTDKPGANNDNGNRSEVKEEWWRGALCILATIFLIVCLGLGALVTYISYKEKSTSHPQPFSDSIGVREPSKDSTIRWTLITDGGPNSAGYVVSGTITQITALNRAELVPAGAHIYGVRQSSGIFGNDWVIMFEKDSKMIEWHLKGTSTKVSASEEAYSSKSTSSTTEGTEYELIVGH